MGLTRWLHRLMGLLSRLRIKPRPPDHQPAGAEARSVEDKLAKQDNIYPLW